MDTKNSLLDTSEKQYAAKMFYEKYGFREYKRGTLAERQVVFVSLFLNKIDKNSVFKRRLQDSLFST